MVANAGTDARTLTWTVEGDGERLDQHVAAAVSDLSRSEAQKLIRAGEVVVNGKPAKPSQLLRSGDEVRVNVPARDSGAVTPEDIDVTIVYESADVVVVDKPAGVLVHPATGQPAGTLVNAMLFRYPEMLAVGPIGRQGVVHRLDKDTSGLVIFGRTIRGLRFVQEQFRRHEVSKTYLALVVGTMEPEKGVIDAPVGRHPRDRKRQAVVLQGGRPARTQYETVATFRGYSLVRAHPLTGRTHQIRVHFAALSHPVAGDQLYGRGTADKDAGSGRSKDTASGRPLGLQRQFLHAHLLRFRDPGREEPVELESPLPADLRAVLTALESGE
ncbi:MAG: RluA family pseudouridine synthase [Anaerolineae bacterium]